MNKIFKEQIYNGIKYINYDCPGCKMTHSIPVEGNNAWGYNNDINNVTLTPSILCKYGKSGVCHHFVKNGEIEFLSDCHRNNSNKDN